MKNLNIGLLIVLALFFASCGEDESPTGTTPPEMEEEMTVSALELAREEALDILTNSDAEKIWKITQALLVNNNGSFDVSSNFNVVDDKFIFSLINGNQPNLEWRSYNSVPALAETQNETLRSSYIDPVNAAFQFESDSSTDLISLNGNFEFSIQNDNTILGTLNVLENGNNVNSQLEFTLSPQSASDLDIVAQTLNFTQTTTIFRDRAFLDSGNIGFTGSLISNSLYVSHRDECEDFGMQTRTTKIDLNDFSVVEHISDEPDFATRQLEIIDDELHLIMAQRLLTYELDIEEDPAFNFYFTDMTVIQTRYSTCNSGNNIYVTTGDDFDPEHKIKRINTSNGSFEIISTLPSPRFHAGSELVNNKIYIFGGRQAFAADNAETESFVYDISNDEIDSFSLPLPLSNTYVNRVGDLIYIAGEIFEYDNTNGNLENRDVWLGVYDTITGAIVEISHNIDDADAFSSVHAMTIVGDKMYVIYGDPSLEGNCVQHEYEVLEASLN